MNPVTTEKFILDSFKTALAQAFPGRIVTRSLKDFGQRKKEELRAGIYTVLANGRPEGDVVYQTLNFIVVGQFGLPESATGEQVEDLELQMIREVTTLIQRQRRGPDIRVLRVDQSAQLEVPFGWMSMQLAAGPYDGTELLTEDENLGDLTDFLSFRADFDAGQPHQTGAEHAKWGGDPADYTGSKPDAQMVVTIPRSE